MESTAEGPLCSVTESGEGKDVIGGYINEQLGMRFDVFTYFILPLSTSCSLVLPDNAAFMYSISVIEGA